jgi:hypothetical protein
MAYRIDAPQIRAAKAAHELFMVNLGALLLLGPLAIFSGIGRLGLLLPLLVSVAFALYSYRKMRGSAHWFVAMHWRLALLNYRWLFLGLALSGLLLLISWGVEVSVRADSPSQFLAVALVRIGIMPALILLFACFVMGNGALNQALRHEVPTRLEQAYPPPPELQPVEE